MSRLARSGVMWLPFVFWMRNCSWWRMSSFAALPSWIDVIHRSTRSETPSSSLAVTAEGKLAGDGE